MKRNRKGIYTAITAGLFAGALVLSAGVLAQDGNLKTNTNAIVVQQSTAVATFVGGTATSGGQIHVRIDGPSGANVFEATSKAGLVDWVLDANLPDGRYNYDAWFTPAAALERSEQQREADEGAAANAAEGQTLYESGVFVIQGGILVPQVSAPSHGDPLAWLQNAAGAVLNFVVPTAAAQNITGTHYDLSAANLHFHYNDSASIGDDWVLQPSDTAYVLKYGGFDAAGTDVFSIEAAAPANSLFVESTGQIGLGTSTPQDRLHLANGAARFTIGSSDWRIGEATGQVGDFAIRLDGFAAPSILIEDGSGGAGTDGFVGIFETNPEVPLHVSRSAGAAIRVENTAATPADDVMFQLFNDSGKTRFAIRSGATSWTFDNDPTINSFSITRVGDDALTEFRVNGDGDGFFTGDVVANGVLLTSSRALKTGFTQIDEADLLAKLAQLDITKWRYKSEPSSAEHIGPMAEQFQAVFGMGDGKHLEMVDTTGITFASIQALVAENKKLKVDNAEHQSAIASLRSDVAGLLKVVKALANSR